MAKRMLHGLAVVVASLGLLCWFAIFAYADWLRFTCPKQPDPTTGHVVYEKAAKGVFYITSEQAFWVQGAALPIWLTFVGGIILGGATQEKGRNNTLSTPSLIAGALFVACAIALLLFGDEVMSLLFTGSPLPPKT
jgi:hypothetical protein